MLKKRQVDFHQLDNLLITKLEIPLLGTHIVARERLTAPLNEVAQRRVTLVTAPTGYGKTTLLVEWLTGMRARNWHTVWISLDRYDNVSLRIWSYIITGLKKIYPRLQYNLQQMVQGGFDPSDHTLLNPLINEISQIPFQVCLILDDFQAIEDSQVLCSLDYLIEHQPSNLHLVISSRSFPRLALTRLRAQRQLLEITARDLSFNLPEAKSFLTNVMELNVDMVQVAALLEATEGWIAGIQLAALSGQGGQVSGLLRPEQLHENRQILDYLTAEVLNQQPPEIKEFLLKTSILSELCVPLCDFILGAQDSQHMLAHVEQANLFLVCLDERQGFYRYHPLFAEALELQLKGAYASLVPELHARACAWLLENRSPEKAVSHALAAGDTEKAADIIEACAMRAIIDYDIPSLLQWMGYFGREMFVRRPKLGIYYALANQHAGRTDLTYTTLKEVAQVLERVDELGISAEEQRVLNWQISAIRVGNECLRGNYKQGIPHLRQLLADHPPVDAYFDGYLHYAMGVALDFAGDLETAVAAFDKGGEFAIPNHKIEYIHGRSEAARLRKKQGRLAEARDLYLNAINFARKTSLHADILTLPQSGLMELALEANDLSAAQALAEEIEAHLDQLDSAPPTRVFFGIIVTRLAAYFLARQDLDRARFYHQKALRYWENFKGKAFIPSPDFASLHVRLYPAESGQAGSPYEIVSRLLTAPREGQSSYALLAHRLVLARLALAQNDPARASSILADLEPTLRESSFVEKLLEAHLLLALACQAQGEMSLALKWIELALGPARTGGYVRLFLDLGEEMHALLQRFVATAEGGEPGEDGKMDGSALDYARKLVDSFCNIPSLAPQTGPEELPEATVLSTLSEPLSPREMEVLQVLLLDRSVKEIAATLMISVNTTKVHLKNIYRKMGSHSRKMIFERARLLQRLDTEI